MKILLFLLAMLIFAATGWSTSEVVRGYRIGTMPTLFARRSDAVVRDDSDNFRFLTATVANVLGILVTTFSEPLDEGTEMTF